VAYPFGSTGGRGPHTALHQPLATWPTGIEADKACSDLFWHWVQPCSGKARGLWAVPPLGYGAPLKCSRRTTSLPRAQRHGDLTHV